MFTRLRGGVYQLRLKGSPRPRVYRVVIGVVISAPAINTTTALKFLAFGLRVSSLKCQALKNCCTVLL